MLADRIRGLTEGIRAALARAVGKLGISPNTLTVAGYVLHLPALYALATGHMRLGGLAVAVASLFDALDGSVAREMRQASAFGAFLDSTLDRYSEATILLGLLMHYSRKGALLETVLTYVAMVGSFMVSYTRARAEGAGIACKAGWFTRFERVMLIVICLVTRQLRLLLWALAILANLTAAQRVLYVWGETRDRDEPGPRGGDTG
jgi:CDP-diacylglycerol--glycerol-3-phosphate 3-phosphatidyltransferase